MITKKWFLLFGPFTLFLAACADDNKPLCQDTAGYRTAAINWDQIPTYDSRGCKVSPGQNPFSPLYKTATGPDKESGSVYVKIEILDNCKNDTWYNWYYWDKIWGYHDNLLVPVNKKFRLTVEYRENCLSDCYIPDHFTSTSFKSETNIDPKDWTPSTVYTLNIPTYAFEETVCK